MSKKILIFSALAIMLAQTTPSFALFLLDQVMNKDVQQKTGVAKLTPNQRKALKTWLNQTFELKTVKEEPKEAEIFLSINIDGGKKLELSDGSTWEVDPNDVGQSSVWITPFPMRIVPSNDSNYPFLLVNKISGISVKARKISPSVETNAPTPSVETNTPSSSVEMDTPNP